MPLRNLMLIALAVVGAALCHSKSEENLYARKVGAAIRLVEQHYIEPVPADKLYDKAMSGMIGDLDAYSAFVSGEEYQRLRDDLKQHFGGIGIVVEPEPDNRGILVMSPLAESPADRAGIKPGDVITSINGNSIEDKRFTDAIKGLRGEPGTSVALTLVRRGEKEPLDLSLTRELIQTDSVQGDYRLPGGKWSFTLEHEPQIGYIRLLEFGERTSEELKRALSQVQDCRGVVLDLRGNPGGYLEAACDVCDQFLEEGKLIVTVKGRGREASGRKHVAAAGVELPPETPLAILVNRYSASAAEITAACLQDHRRAVVVGTRTWGKGSVQNLFELDGGTAAIKLTTATYWRPSGRNIHRLPKDPDTAEWGVSPSAGLAVDLSAEEEDQVHLRRRRRDILREPGESSSPARDDKPAPGPEVDRQLAAAVKHLLSQTAAPASTSEPAASEPHR